MERSSWNGRDGAIMTPSPCWRPPRSPAWMRRPADPARPRTGQGRRPGSARASLAGAPHAARSRPLRRLAASAARPRLHRRGAQAAPASRRGGAHLDRRTPRSVTAPIGVVERDAARSRLPPPGAGARALIVLHHYLDLPLPEVAVTLGIPLGTAKSRLHRALALHARGARRRRPDRRRSAEGGGMNADDGFVRTSSGCSTARPGTARRLPRPKSSTDHPGPTAAVVVEPRKVASRGPDHAPSPRPVDPPAR